MDPSGEESKNASSRGFSGPGVDDSVTVFPLSRIRMIMKSSPDVTNVGQDGLFVMTKAVEYFVAHLAENAFEGRRLTYAELAKYVQENEDLEFLHEILPHKMKVQDVWRLMQFDSEKPNKSDHCY